MVFEVEARVVKLELDPTRKGLKMWARRDGEMRR